MPPQSSADGRRSSSATASGSSAAADAAAAVSTVAALSTSTSSSPSLPRAKALSDAVAGVIASLVSLWCFYPFEIWKLQAQTASSISTFTAGRQQQPQHPHQQRLGVDDDDIILDLQSTLVSPPPPLSPRKDQGISANAAAISSWSHEQLAHYRLCKWQSLFAGLVPKSVHTAASSFCYFYLYSWIVAVYQQYRMQRLRRLQRRGVPSAASSSTAVIAPTTRLILSALAALINTFLTLPMDVISTQYQLQGSNGTGGTAALGATADDEDDAGTETYIFYDASGSSDEEDESNTSFYNSQPQQPQQQQQQQQFGFSMDESILSNDCDDERHDENLANDKRQKLDRDHDVDNDPQAAFRHSGHASTAHTITSALVRLRSYWKGLLPSLLLCSNPAIHFTVYDVTKAWYLSSSHMRVVAQEQSRQKQRLGLIESFLLGLVAKFVATMATYPLIQAKVRLMSSLHDDTIPTGHTSSSGSGSTGITNPTLWSCLCHDFNDAGLAGLYRGCHLQLLHTLLKTALVMMLRERIELSTRQWLLVPTESTDTKQIRS